MTLTAIDASSALIAVDLQQGILNFADPAEREKIVKNTARLADEFHARNLPVIWVRALGMPAGRKEMGPPAGGHDESWNAPDENLPIDESRDLVVFKRALSCFTVPETTEYLKKHGSTQVVITGLAAGVGVESTARSAFDAGYNVTVVSDAVTDGMPERLESALKISMPSFAEIGTTQNVLDLLA